MEQHKPIYSLESVNEFADGDNDFIKQVVSVFIDDTPKAISQMHQFFQEQDWKGLKEIAHKYKSHVAMLKIGKATELVKKIEKNAESKTNLAEIPSLIDELDSNCVNVIKKLRSDIGLIA